MPKFPKGAKRRARGTGSIFRDKRRGGWVGRVSVGRGVNGRPIYREYRAQTQDEVVSLMRGAEPPDASVTLSEWYPRWLSSILVRPATRTVYEQAFKHRILPLFGTRKVSAITAHDVESACVAWGSQASAGTVRLTVRVLNVCISAAVRADVMPANRVKHARIPKIADSQIQPFTVAELNAIIEATKGELKFHPFALLAGTGCRLGEVLGLQKGDYDSTTGEVSISRSLNQNGKLGPPKSKNGIRKIAVPESVRFSLTIPFKVTSRAAIHKHWNRLLASLDLPYRNIHQLRHTFATLAIANNAPLADVARHLGDTVATVVKTYVHASGFDVGRSFQNLLSGATVAENPPTARN